MGVEKTETFDENASYREVGQISSLKLKMLLNVLPVEASHSSLDQFERPPVLITFDTSFELKIGPLYSPNGTYFGIRSSRRQNQLHRFTEHLPRSEVQNSSVGQQYASFHHWRCSGKWFTHFRQQQITLVIF